MLSCGCHQGLWPPLPSSSFYFLPLPQGRWEGRGRKAGRVMGTVPGHSEVGQLCIQGSYCETRLTTEMPPDTWCSPIPPSRSQDRSQIVCMYTTYSPNFFFFFLKLPNKKPQAKTNKPTILTHCTSVLNACTICFFCN